MTTDSTSSDLPDTLGILGDTNRDVLAVYDAVIDPDAGTFTVTPVERIGTYHLALNLYFPNCLIIVGYGFTPNFWADIKLRHPQPGSGMDVFDPRVIAILPALPGVSFNYPTLNAIGNNSVVLEPDGYTKLFDGLGGLIPGNTNPFKAYFKDQPYRVWSSTGVTEETQHWNMNLAGFGGPITYKLVVDVSTNWQNPPQPIIDNAPEPVQINALVNKGMSPDAGCANILVTLLDWQGSGGIGGVLVEAPDLFNGTEDLEYSGNGLNPNEYLYRGTITNSLFASEGEYKFLIATWDMATSIYMYNEFKINVSYVPEGNLIWAKSAGGAQGDDIGLAITTLSNNSTVVTGHFQYIATFGRGEPNQTVLTSPVSCSDIFIARYNPGGTLAWAKSAGGEGWDKGFGITTLSNDSTVVTGAFSSTATFGRGEPNQTVLTSTGYEDIFIARYNPNGTLAWAKSVGGSDLASDEGLGITALPDNSTVVTGFYYYSYDNWDIFIAKYDQDGTSLWFKRAGGSSYDWGNGITTLSDNSTVVTGYFDDSATFGPDEPNQTILISAGGNDVFIARYNPDGTLAWAKRAGGTGWDEGCGTTTLSANSTVATGKFADSATFGLGEPNQTVLSSAGGHDIFVARYNPDGTLVWAKQAGGIYGYYNKDVGEEITTLSDNSTVITGNFTNFATFGLGEPNQTVLLGGGGDIFVARYNSNGTLSWAKSAGGIDGGGVGFGITTLSDNSTVATGEFAYSAVFGPCEPNETVLTSASAADIFIARFAP